MARRARWRVVSCAGTQQISEPGAVRANAQQATIKPVITAAVVSGTLVRVDEGAIYVRLPTRSYGHKTALPRAGEYARDEDGDGFCETHVDTMKGFWSLLRSGLCLHRGIPQDKLLLQHAFFRFVHNACRCGEALLSALVACLLA